ncbi:MAG TPA: hypothetical protein VF587_18255 [Solirubrobacteraceae bacterium]
MSASASDLLAHLDQLAERVREARAAAETIAEGDPTALAELDAEVDAMAQDVAALKAISGGGVGGGAPPAA